MKIKNIFYAMAFCICLPAFTGCGENPSAKDNAPAKGDFDFGRYYNQDISRFLEDYGLDEDDLVITEAYNYESWELLPFLDTTATYRLLCAEDGTVAMAEVQLFTEKGIPESYEALARVREYFNSQENSQDLYELKINRGTVNMNTYQSAKELEAAVWDAAEHSEDERYKTAFSLRGVWNLEPDLQVDASYRLRLEDEQGLIDLVFYDRALPRAYTEEKPAPATAFIDDPMRMIDTAD